MITEKQLRSRQRRAQEAEARFKRAQAYRDAAIVQAVAEGRMTQTEIARIIGVTKARVGKITSGAARTTP